MKQTDFVLMLHAHLPYVLNHGRWPHGSDWICEAAIDTYLPLLERLHALDAGNVVAPLTIGFTPILANQLEHPGFVRELEAYVEQRLERCAAAAAAMRGTADEALVPLAGFWELHLRRLRALFRELDGDIIGAFRRLQDGERLEITSSAATHAFLPMLGRDESIRLQLELGRAEHRRLFGRLPDGCWVPECAYRARGMWSPLPGTPNAGVRRGIDEHLSDAGYRYFFVDSHMAKAGDPLGLYGALFAGEPERRATELPAPARQRRPTTYTPYRAYRVTAGRSGADVAALVRDPRSSMRVWNRHGGYPGDGAYLEFHKIRWPDGLRLWRVTDRTSDLGDKEPYDPEAARVVAGAHARDFAALLADVAMRNAAAGGSVIVTPFDAELFGHWWFEGPDFITGLYAAIPGHAAIRAVTASQHLDGVAPRTGLRLARGSWGKDGDFSMWVNDQVNWTWEATWAIENAFWALAPSALDRPELHDILAQAARSMLLLQSSDWQFIITTGEVEDYAIRRFTGHAEETRELLGILGDGLAGRDIDPGHARAAELQARDDVFREILPSVAAALGDGRRHPGDGGAIRAEPANVSSLADA